MLTETQRQIQQEVQSFNDVKEVHVTAVIGRLAGIQGSMTASIKTLAVVNQLLIKGKQITDEEWGEVFEKLED